MLTDSWEKVYGRRKTETNVDLVFETVSTFEFQGPQQGRIWDFLEGGGWWGLGRFSKKNLRKFRRLFYRSTELIFRALPKHGLVPVLGSFSRPKMDFLKGTKGGTLWVGRKSNP